MRRCISGLAAVFLLCGSAPLGAETKQVFVRGAGQETCAAWQSARSRWFLNSSPAYLNWVLGFIAAYNDFVHTQEPQNNSGVDLNLGNEPLAAWLDKFCRTNPSKTIYSASIALIDELKPR